MTEVIFPLIVAGKLMKVKLYLPSIFVILLFHSTLITLPYWSGYYYFKYFTILVIGIFLLLKYKIDGKYFEINMVLFAYCGMMLVSSFINRDIIASRDVFLSTIVQTALFIESFLLFEYFAEKDKTHYIIETFYKLLLIYVILTDVIMIVKPDLFSTFGGYYLIGNKFRVAYIHLQLIVFYLQKIKLKKSAMGVKEFIILIIFCILTLIICIRVESSTGIIGLIILACFLLLSKSRYKSIKSPKTVIFTIILSSVVLVFFSNIFLDNKYVAYFIEDVLKEDMTLTGRTEIYKRLPEVLSGHWFLGYGYGSSYEVMYSFMRAPNTQNGLFECILEQGVVATFLLLVLIYKVFSYNRKNTFNLPVIIMIYIYGILSSVEITLNLPFMVFLATVLVFSTYENNSAQVRLTKNNYSSQKAGLLK